MRHNFVIFSKTRANIRSLIAKKDYEIHLTEFIISEYFKHYHQTSYRDRSKNLNHHGTYMKYSIHVARKAHQKNRGSRK